MTLERCRPDRIQSSRSSALREADERAWQLAAIVESSDDSIVGTDLERRITSWNRGAERIFGYTAEEAWGMPIAIVIPEDRRAEEIAIFERMRGGERIEPFDTFRRDKTGRVFDVSLSVSPIRNLDGQIVGACSITRDITERKRSEKRIAMLAREAEHRTKNVLQAVHTIVLLSQARTSEELKRVIEGRIRALANAHGLLAESRWVDADLAKLASQELAPYLQQEQPRARLDGPHVPVRPSAAQALAIILHELATNAAKYGALSEIHGRVEIKWVQLSDDRLLLTWTERGGPVITPPIRHGFGTHVIETSAKMDLQGKVRFEWRAEGLVCEIELQI
jgi:PAS domain S-box-containing protein